MVRVRVVGPQDVALTNVSNQTRVLDHPRDRSGETLAAVGNAVSEIVDAARDQQIENQVAAAELRTRKQLDELRDEVDQDPDHSTMQARWAEGAARIVAENAGGLRTEAWQNAWRARATQMLETERRTIGQLQETREVEAGRAGLIEQVQGAQQALVDPNSSPAMRATALATITEHVNSAVSRRTIGADDGARMIATARGALAEYEATEGLRAQSQVLEDEIVRTSGGNYAAAMEAAREIPNAQMRDTVTERLERRFNQIESARHESVRVATADALERIENGELLSDIPRGTREVLIANAHWDEIRNYARSRATNMGGGSILASQSEAVADELLADALSPEGARVFANMDLTPHLTRMNPDDRARVQRHQAYLRGDAPATEGGQTLIERAYDDIRAAGVIRANENGIDVDGAGQNGRNIANRGRFNAFIMGAARRFVDENHRVPRGPEADEIARMAFLRAQGTFGPDQNRRVYSSGTINNGTAPAMRVRYSQIPTWEVARLARMFRDANDGANPTVAQIENAYALELAGEH